MPEPGPVDLRPIVTCLCYTTQMSSWSGAWRCQEGWKETPSDRPYLGTMKSHTLLPRTRGKLLYQCTVLEEKPWGGKAMILVKVVAIISLTGFILIPKTCEFYILFRNTPMFGIKVGWLKMQTDVESSAVSTYSRLDKCVFTLVTSCTRPLPLPRPLPPPLHSVSSHSIL